MLHKHGHYYPLSLKALEPGGQLPFGIYLRSRPQLYHLYLPAGIPLTDSSYQHLKKVGDRKVYVNWHDRDRHLVYLKDLLEMVVRDEGMGMEKRAALIYATTQEIVRQALEQPMPATIRACAAAARSQVKLILNDPEALLQILKICSFDYYTYTHSVNVGFMLVGMLTRLEPHLDIQTLSSYGLGALLHDIGKIRLSKELLNKPGPFTAAEYAEMQRHPQLGATLVQQSYSIPSQTESIILHHHENLDGSGYPDGLIAAEMPLPIRLVRIIDIYDALTTQRHYKAALHPYRAFILIKEEFAHKVDQELVQELIRLVGHSRPSQAKAQH